MDLINDCRLAAKTLKDTETFPTGQGILLDAANEIELLRHTLKEILDGVDCQPGYIRGSGIRLAQEALNRAKK